MILTSRRSPLIVVACAALASACAASHVGPPPRHEAGPASSASIASATVVPRDLAFGTPARATTSATPQRAALDLDPYLRHDARARPKQAAQHSAKAIPEPRRAATPPPARPAAPVELASAQPQSQSQPQSQRAREPTPLAPQDAERYAAREQNADSQLQYRGGDVVVISVTTILVVAIIVLLILLLT